MAEYTLKFTITDIEIIKRADEIKKLLIYSQKKINSFEGKEFHNKVIGLFESNLEELLKKYNYITLNEFCLKNKIGSFYKEGKLTYESASNVIHHTRNAVVFVINTLNSHGSWVYNYPEEWLNKLIPTILGQPSIQYCH